MSVIAKFKPGSTRTFTQPVYRYDYGQTLQFEGIELPETFIVHFSNTEELGVATTAFGTNNEVPIPDEYLRHNWDYIFAFVYVGDGKTGRTAWEAVIPVQNRPGLADPIPTPVEESVIQQGIAIMNDALEKIGPAAEMLDELAQILDDFKNGEFVLDGKDAEAVAGGEDDGGTDEII